MTIETLRELLLWCTVINYSVLLIWFAFFSMGQNFVYNLHNRWFKIDPQAFVAIHYGGMGLYKLLIFIFNLAPLIALYIIA